MPSAGLCWLLHCTPRKGPAFTVGDIRVEGLQRVTEGTVYNYLPINIGDNLSAQRIREAVRALYDTGFFRDVELRRDGNTLIVVVNERPTIESFELKGNKDIKTEDLSKSLRNVGPRAGQDLRPFGARGREVVPAGPVRRARQVRGAHRHHRSRKSPGNRVKIKIDIVEGKRAKIRQINIVGNQTFKEKDILEAFELKTPNLLSFYKQDDRYSRESLQGDLEKLRSFYMDRGYANFEVESTQVAIAPEKDDIFITVNVNEGEVFKVKEVKLAGTFVVPEPLLRRYLLVQPGDTFSRKIITATQELLQNRLGEDGFAFAKVDPVPTTIGDPANKELSLTFFVDPGNRVYVRHIAFNGVSKINDEVLRREMRQLEGGWLSNAALDRSKQRLERLPYIKKVESETKPVAGSTDLVDVTYEIEEGPSAQLGGGIGYSESQSFILSGNYADANFLGTGRRVSIDLNSGKYSKVYGVSMTEPYFTRQRRGPHRQRHLSRPDPVRVGVVGLLVGDDRRGFRHRLSDRREPGPAHGPAVPEIEPAHQRRAAARARPSSGWTPTAIPTASASTTTTTIPSCDVSAGGHRVQHGRVHHLVELRQPQSLAVCRSRHAALVRPGLRAARCQRRRVLRRELRVHQIHPAVWPVHAAAGRRPRLRHGHRRHHGAAAVSAVLRRRTGDGARI